MKLKLQTVAAWLLGAVTVAGYFCGALISPGFYAPAVILTLVTIIFLVAGVCDEEC